jgi:trehalose 6-phosphate phosphatase
VDRSPLDVLRARAERAGIFLDFDGTLSEIAPTPVEARAVAGAAGALAALAERFGVVAVVSGRLAAEVEERLGSPAGVRVFGLYGRERGGEESLASSADTILPRVRAAAREVPGALVEPKGPNIAVHYRQASSPTARQDLLRALGLAARDAGMELLEGKRVIEIVPAGAPAKGELVEREGSGLEALLYAGDDLADVEAFAAVDRLAVRGTHGVKVAVRSAETPAELVDAEDLVAEGPAGLLGLLRALLG